MSATIPESHRDLLERPIVVALATVLPDGQPQVNCVWCTYDGTHVLMFTIRGFRKERNMRERPVATILAVDPQNPYRYLEVRGVVEEMSEEGAEQLADKLAREYKNKPTYYGHVEPADKRGKAVLVACKVRPTKVVAYG